MNIQTTKKALAAALSHLTRIIPSGSSNAALTNLVMRIVPGGISLGGTNTEIDLELTVSAELPLGAAGGPWLVPAHLFAQIVAKAGGPLIELQVRDQTLQVSSGGNTTKIQLAAPEGAPTLTFADHSSGMPAPADLLTSITTTAYACASTAFQSVFRGMLLRFTAESTRTVTSDGYRIARRDGLPVEGFTGVRGVIVPRRNIEELARLLDSDKSVRLHLGDGTLGLTRDDARMTVKLIDGDFPDYERVTPKHVSLKATLSGAAFAEALDRVSVLADKNANTRTELMFAEGKIILKTEGDYGTAEDVVDATLSGPEPRMEIAVNGAYTLQAIKQMTAAGGEIQLNLANSTSPIVYQSAADAGQQAVVVSLSR